LTARSRPEKSGKLFEKYVVGSLAKKKIKEETEAEAPTASSPLKKPRQSYVDARSSVWITARKGEATVAGNAHAPAGRGRFPSSSAGWQLGDLKQTLLIRRGYSVCAYPTSVEPGD